MDTCERGRLASLVGTADWVPLTPRGPSPEPCADCIRLAETFAAFARVVTARLEALERRRLLGVRGPGQAQEATCEMCGRIFVRRSVLGRRCDQCRAEWKRQHNRRVSAARKAARP